MCEFNEAWLGKCKEENVKNEDFCSKHIKEKCVVCGKQATHTCSGQFGFLICGESLCDSDDCNLQHYYQHHGFSIGEIVPLEKKLNKKRSRYVFSKIDYNHENPSKIDLFFKEKYSDRIDLLIATYDSDNNIKFFKTNLSYFFKTKEEVLKFIEDYSLCFKQFDDINCYFSNQAINIKKIFKENIFKEFEKL